MRRNNEHLIGIEVERPVVQLRFRIQVVVKALALHPPYKTPFCWCDVASCTSGDGVGNVHIFGYVVDRFWAVKRKRCIFFRVVVDVFGIGIAF